MLVANKNAFTTLRLYGSSPTISNTLTSVLIKNAQEYTGTVLSFYTNADPPVIYNTEPLLYIRPKLDPASVYTQQFPAPDPLYLPATPFTEEIFTFRGSNETSMCELMHNLHNFFTRFDRVIHDHGTHWNDDLHIRSDAALFANIGIKHISCTLTESLALRLLAEDGFMTNFYFEFTELGNQVLGFDDTYLYAYVEQLTGDIVASPEPDAEPLFDDFHYFNVDQVVPIGLMFNAGRPITEGDLRHSLKIELSIPIERTVFVETTPLVTKFTHKYLLAEYIFKKLSFHTNTMTVEDVLIDTFSSHSKLSGGLTDLGSHDKRFFKLLPGEIQAMNTRFFVSYIQADKTLKDFPLPFEDRFYDLTILFIKKDEDDRPHDK